MEKERKKGWLYFYSEELKQEIAYSDRVEKIYCEDGTVYTLSELETVLRNEKKVIPEKVHFLKKIFKGKIIF